MGLGKILYKIYYRPKAYLKKSRNQGLLNTIAIARSQKKMAAYALTLQEIYNPVLPTSDIYFLTGKKYWYQTAFCLHSLQKVCPDDQINGVFIDDGTITPSLKNKITQQFPNSKLILADEIEAILDTHLPCDKYPVIRAKRAVYPHIKKLTDIHAGSNNWKLVADSDMLFFKQPDELINWLKNPTKPIFLHDRVNSYHYSSQLMSTLAEGNIDPNINVGIAGLKSENIDWDKLECWIQRLEHEEGSSYLLEQALSAMLVANQQFTIADSDNYIVMPDKTETENMTAKMHHYVAQSKEWYYKIAWKTLV